MNHQEESDEMRWERLVRGFRLNPGFNEHRFRECGLCGRLDWVTSIQNAPKRIVIEPLQVEMDGACPTCAEVHRRAPELVEWITRVIGKHMRPKP